MTVGAWKIYGGGLESVLKSNIDLDTNAIRMVLVTSSYTPNQSTHTTWADVSANEVANGGGYTTHGKLLTATVTRSGLVVTFDADDQTWASSTITAKYAVLVKDADANGALASTDLLLAYMDLKTEGGSESSNNGSFVVGFNASGAFTFTAP